nr:MAG TPA: hypothetical protein [Bacteriophage sp.]DAN56507.1 MAG TPA: hypothetical protein [Bacteriophage sp.]
MFVVKFFFSFFLTMRSSPNELLAPFDYIT